MSDYFSRNISYAGSHKPESVMFTNLGGLGSGLVTGVNLDYTQQVSRMWSLFGSGNAECYLVAGDTSGNCSVSALYGLGNAQKPGDICSPEPVSIVLTDNGCSGGLSGGLAGPPQAGGSRGSMNITMNDSVPTAYGIQGNNGNMQIIESAAITFISLSTS